MEGWFDAAFDRGFITVEDDGIVIVSSQLENVDRKALGLDVPRQLIELAPGHARYLAWHRENWFVDARDSAVGSGVSTGFANH